MLLPSMPPPECDHCKAKVYDQAAVEVTTPIYDPEAAEWYAMNYGNIFEQECRVPPRWVYGLVKCSSCGDALVVRRFDFEGPDASKRIWPPFGPRLPGLPALIAEAIDEAERCLKASAPLACALMCRRALEAMCRHHYPDIRPLAFGLKKLEDDGVIDARLARWAQVLRDSGNLAAHDPSASITQYDAADLLDFTEAILSYVFVMHERFEHFQRRRRITDTSGA